MLIIYRYITTSAVVAVNGGNPLFTAPGYLLSFGAELKPVYPKTQAEYSKKMEELQSMADKRLKKKFQQKPNPEDGKRVKDGLCDIAIDFMLRKNKLLLSIIENICTC
jgi:hypothetical protein